MKRLTITAALAVGLLCLLFGSRSGQSQEASPARPRAILTKPYTPQLGDMIALTTGQLLTSLKTVTAPTLSVYDHEAKKVGIVVYGKKATLDAAKATLDGIRDSMTTMRDIVGAIYGVTLDEKDFEYAYYDIASGAELVHWADGTYTLGEEKEGEGD